MSTDVEQDQPDQPERVYLKDLIAAGVDARLQEAGYIDEDGERAFDALAERLADRVYPGARATKAGEQEKSTKAISKGDIIAFALPNLPGPSRWKDEPDPELAEGVYTWIENKIWQQLLKVDASGPVQQLIGDKGVLLCKTKIGTNKVASVYCTDVLPLLKEDFNAPLAEKVNRANLTMSMNMNMAIARLPQHYRAFEKAYKDANHAALEAGSQMMLPALEAAKEQQRGTDDE
jgi:hypothetical protein